MGYTDEIQVDVNGVPVLFEPDEKRSYRAYIDPIIPGAFRVDIGLLKAIVEAIEGILK